MENDYMIKDIKVFAFVGPSGTGKSYRAQMVAAENDVHFIIDDGLLIKDNEVIAGNSAKKASTKIETVKKALFIQEEQSKEIQKALKKYKAESILLLGTSDGMVEKIAENLKLPKISKTIYINDVLLDPLQIFKTRGNGQKPYISEKSIIRPTFSYMGNFTISDNVFKQLVEYLAIKQEEVKRVLKTRVRNSDEGAVIYMEVEVVYGCNVVETLKDFKMKATREIENWTSMNVAKMDVVAKSIYYEE